MLTKVKNALRIGTDKLDDEINDIIRAAMEDLNSVGINGYDTGNPLIVRAIILYSRAHFALQDDTGRFEKSYARLKLQLMISGGDCE